MPKYKASSSFISVLIFLSLVLYFTQGLFSMMVFRLFQGDGARAMLGLLGAREIYYEHPFIRLSAVFLQWPYLIASLFFDFNISEARWLISFSYSFVPFFYVLMFLIDGVLSKKLKWFWMVLGIVAFVHLPQAQNQFNTVLESSFLFLLYLYVNEEVDKRMSVPLRVILIIFFVLSHETSIVYTFAIALLPSLKDSFREKRIVLKTSWEFYLGLTATLAIFIHYLFLPSFEHIKFKEDTWSIFINPVSWIFILFFIQCLSLVKNIKVFVYVTSSIILFLVWRVLHKDLVSHHYPFRLAASCVTTSWCLFCIFFPELLRFRSLQFLLLFLVGFFSIKDLGYSNKWDLAMKRLELYLHGKVGCYQEESLDKIKWLNELGYFGNADVTFDALSLSPNFSEPRIVVMPMPGSKNHPGFDTCEYPDENFFALDERSGDKRYHFWLNRFYTFNFDKLYMSLPGPHLKLSHTYSPGKKMFINGKWYSDDFKFKKDLAYHVRVKARGECVEEECPEFKIFFSEREWTFKTEKDMKEFTFEYQADFEGIQNLGLEYLNDRYDTMDQDMNLILERIDISPVVVKKKVNSIRFVSRHHKQQGQRLAE